MNSNQIEATRNKYRGNPSSSFTSVHPPGGFVAWPDGRTTRIGEIKKGFVAWPANKNKAGSKQTEA